PFAPVLAGEDILDDLIAMCGLHAPVHVGGEIHGQAQESEFGVGVHLLVTDAGLGAIVVGDDLATLGNDCLQLVSEFTEEGDVRVALSLAPFEALPFLRLGVFLFIEHVGFLLKGPGHEPRPVDYAARASSFTLMASMMPLAVRWMASSDSAKASLLPE